MQRLWFGLMSGIFFALSLLGGDVVYVPHQGQTLGIGDTYMIHENHKPGAIVKVGKSDEEAKKAIEVKRKVLVAKSSKQICANPSFKQLIEAGGKVVFVYNTTAGGRLYIIVDECASGSQ